MGKYARKALLITLKLCASDPPQVCKQSQGIIIATHTMHKMVKILYAYNKPYLRPNTTEQVSKISCKNPQ